MDSLKSKKWYNIQNINNKINILCKIFLEFILIIYRFYIFSPTEQKIVTPDNEPLEITLSSLFHSESDEEDDY